MGFNELKKRVEELETEMPDKHLHILLKGQKADRTMCNSRCKNAPFVELNYRMADKYTSQLN